MRFLDGLSGIFWLFLNWGKYGESRRKMFLVVVNLFIVGIGGCLVRKHFFYNIFFLSKGDVADMLSSAEWVFGSRGKRAYSERLPGVIPV
jgi:hypothetical protein